eukprot:13720731-Ditylum_brightwellii.AAC.1
MELLEKAIREGDPSTVKDTEMNSLFEKLHDAGDQVVVPTNKTNAHLLVKLCDYNRWVEQHLQEAAVKVRRAYIVKLHKKAVKYAESLKGLLSAREYGYLMEWLGSKAIPEP